MPQFYLPVCRSSYAADKIQRLNAVGLSLRVSVSQFYTWWWRIYRPNCLIYPSEERSSDLLQLDKQQLALIAFMIYVALRTCNLEERDNNKSESARTRSHKGE